MKQIEINNLTKQDKNQVTALTDISFQVESGVFGLLGHNGSGKTTLMKILATIMRPTSGSVRIGGYDINTQGEEARRLIGYLPQELSMYPALTVFDFVCYMAALTGVKDRKKVMDVLEQVDMGQYAGRRIGQLSGGMKRRVGIAQALAGDPRILIVDEPTAGLDPEERVRFRSVLSRFTKDDKCVLLSTHIVEDVYQLCEKLAVLRKGALFFSGSAEELLSKASGKVKIVEIEKEKNLAALQKKAVVLSVTYEHSGILARILDERGEFPVPPVPETLEDAYVYCMGGKNYE